MMTKYLLSFSFVLYQSLFLNAQDTFSIVAVDSSTSEVGSAGASCVDLVFFPQFSTDFLGELLPGLGAINTQAFYLQNNQVNARNQLLSGQTPAQTVQWLQNNDDQSNPQIRQYGIAALINGYPESAAFTGSQTNAYTGQRLGSNYSIQGNILLGPQILDSMEARFLRAKGDLKCRLMYAMQGANVVGADSRCAANGTSSLFAFLKIAQPSDTFGNPSYLISVQTPDGANIEPIDSLQALFDNSISNPCDSFTTALNEDKIMGRFEVIPNPAENRISFRNLTYDIYEFKIYSLLGSVVKSGVLSGDHFLDISDIFTGSYIISLKDGDKVISSRFFKK